jgi:hypothetical protein
LISRFQGDVYPQQQPIWAIGFIMIALNIEEPEHITRRFFSGITGLQDDLYVGILSTNRLDKLFAAHARHKIVDDNQVNVAWAKECKSFFSAICSQNAVPFSFQQETIGDEGLLLIVYDEDEMP